MFRALIAACALLAPAAASAQDGATLTFGLGAAVAPVYSGADDYGVGPTGSVSVDYFKLGRLQFGTPEPGEGPGGFSVGGSFRIVGERDDADHPELAGLEDIDTAVELGLGLRYAGEGYRVFANVRYGVVGHESFVGEVGGDAVVSASDKLTLYAGPRFQIGSDRYAATYYGVTAAEAAASAFPAYTAEGGLLSAGVEIGMNYQFNDDWGMRGSVGYHRLMGDAGDSPIVQSRTQGRASLMLTRRVSFGF